MEETYFAEVLDAPKESGTFGRVLVGVPEDTGGGGYEGRKLEGGTDGVVDSVLEDVVEDLLVGITDGVLEGVVTGVLDGVLEDVLEEELECVLDDLMVEEGVVVCFGASTGVVELVSLKNGDRGATE